MQNSHILREVKLLYFIFKKTVAESPCILVRVYSESCSIRNSIKDRGKPPKKFKDAELHRLLDEDSTQTLKQLSYLGPSNYYLFQSMQHRLSEQHINSYEDVKNWIDVWWSIRAVVLGRNSPVIKKKMIKSHS